jgi:dTDP-D-glucose 4,6-dehydratase
VTTTSQPAGVPLAGYVPASELRDAECRMYDAECALHFAHQSHVDAWITAAADRLHEAITAHSRALHAARAA